MKKYTISNYHNSKTRSLRNIKKTKIMTTPTVTKIKTLKYYNSKTQMIQNSKCEEKKIKLQHHSKTQNVTKYTISNCYKAYKLKLWLHSKTQIATRFKYLNCEKEKK